MPRRTKLKRIEVELLDAIKSHDLERIKATTKAAEVFLELFEVAERKQERRKEIQNSEDTKRIDELIRKAKVKRNDF